MTTIKRVEPGERDVEEYDCVFCRSKIAIKVKDCHVRGCLEALNVEYLRVWTVCPVCYTINLPQNISVTEVEQWEAYKDKLLLR